MTHDLSEERVLLRFHELYDADCSAGKERSLAEYQALFPGHEQLVAREFGALGASGATEGGEGTGPRDASLAGMRIGRYVVEREIGHGGQGYVWLARDEELKRSVALKLLAHARALMEDARLRFRREAEVASRLEHRNLCTIYEAGSFEGIPFIAMQFVEGESLDRRIAAREAPPQTRSEIDELLRFFVRAAYALHAAHEAGLVHRDVKPANLMVDGEGEPVILDFGLARDDAEAGQDLTLTGEILGTPAYMAPEQIDSRLGSDRRCDVYGLAAALFEALTHRAPHEAPTRHELFHAITKTTAPDCRRFNSKLPRDLACVLARALEKDPGDRYESAAEFGDELRRVENKEAIHARPVSPPERVLRWSRRNPLVASLAALVLALALGGGIALLAQNRQLGASNRSLGESKRDLQHSLAELTEEQRKLATEKEKVLRLADQRRLNVLAEEAERFRPVNPRNVPKLRSWIARAEELVVRLPLHRRELEAIEKQAPPFDDAARKRQHAEAWSKLETARKRIAELEAEAENEESERRLGQIELLTAALESRIESLQGEISERKDWGFDEETAWRHGLLRELVIALERFHSEDGLFPQMRELLERSETIVPRSLDDHAEAWSQAIQRVATNPRYGGLRLRPQLGLIPLGPDPKSGLEEFLHWETHAGAGLPKRGQDERILMDGKNGLIFVLVPGGRFFMGAKPPAPGEAPGPNRDPRARLRVEGPVHEVALDPFFVSKYEMTDGQWLRTTGECPSFQAPGVAAARARGDLPVDSMTWASCERTLGRLGLQIPTEAQWEYAARAGSRSIWYWGDERDLIPQHANTADAYGRDHGGAPNWPYETSFDDGAARSIPGGRYLPNPWGLYDVYGNVFEWCREAYVEYVTRPRPKDAFRDDLTPPRGRAIRGGSFDKDEFYARSAARCFAADTHVSSSLGVRPVRPIDAP